MSCLLHTSIRIIKENQSPTGAYPACPTFPTYQYSWFRDGSFCAYAMDLMGEPESAARFHAWAAGTINANVATIKRALHKVRTGESLDPMDTLHTRYTLNGRMGGEEWPNFQLDGFGTWLWALSEHARLGNRVGEGALLAARHVADYIQALWDRPCFDCWEEFPNQIHTYTLGSIYAGLEAAGELIDVDYWLTRNAVKEYILQRCIQNGAFAKYIGLDQVDGSLVALSVPYGVVPADDPRMLTTVAQIESGLRFGGGVHRYDRDTYYGGGEWVLLTAWLGWYYAYAGQVERANELLGWVEKCADSNGHLPEQVPQSLIDPSYYEPWRKRWGKIASPLLWSHAKYLILSKQFA